MFPENRKKRARRRVFYHAKNSRVCRTFSAMAALSASTDSNACSGTQELMQLDMNELPIQVAVKVEQMRFNGRPTAIDTRSA